MLIALALACTPDPKDPLGPGTSGSGTRDTAVGPTTSDTGGPAPDYPDDVIAFVGVDVLTMRPGEAPLRDRTVVVHDGRILDLAPADTPLPPGATRIDGQGRTLMPGLIDAHVHVWYEGELTLLLANGVTTARNLFGDPLQRGWRDEIAAGTWLGPRLVVSGPIVDGFPPVWPGSDLVLDPAGAQEVVQAQADAGYDLIKVYNRLSPEAYQGILDAAGAIGIPVAGHVPSRVGWDAVVAGPQVTIEHFDGLVDRVAGNDTGTFLFDVAGMTAAMDARDDERLREAADLAAADGVVVVPTVIVVDRFMTAEEAAQAASDPILRYVHPDVAWSWAQSPPLGADTVAMLDRYALEVLDYTAAFHQAGASLALGTDANNPYVVPGFSVHDELTLLVRTGLTPAEALTAATATAAAALGLDDVGMVEVGKRADLLLLEADPTLDVAAAADRAGVMVGGRWLEEVELQAMLEQLAADYAAMRVAGRRG